MYKEFYFKLIEFTRKKMKFKGKYAHVKGEVSLLSKDA